tara:strand:+ start:210 stop:1073 length:864 start_codon:yes stop_codon:yes gene_type:complete
MKDILFKLNKPITLKEGTGVTLTNNGITGTQVIDGTNTSNVQVSIGQSVSTSSNVQFDNVVLSSDSLTVGTGSDTLVFSDGKLVGDVTFQQNVEITEDLTIIGNLVYTDSVTATTIITGSSQVTQSVITGSNIFGGTLSDNQFFTGSFDTTGSIKLNNSNTITEISNDVNATDQSQTSFVTEYAAYEFLTGQSTEGLYLRKSFVHTGSFVNSSTSSFNAITASAPQTLTGTTENDFMFFINGMLVENDALTIEQKASTNLELRLDTSSLGYELSAQDEIIGFGKFNN